MKYAPLQDYLRALPPGQEHVTLSFGELEKIIGAKLPQSAHTYREWWANQQGGARAPHWRAAGFAVDTVQLSRKLVTFKRNGSASPMSAKPRPKPATTRMPSKPISATQLLDAGFQKYGHWELKDGRIHLIGDIPKEPGTYAHVVNGEVFYIGSATMGLKKRLYFYGRPGSTQRTSLRVNGLIRDLLESGNSVELIAAFPEPTSWNGLAVDLVTGLETGLVRKYCPPWNKRGVSA